MTWQKRHLDGKCVNCGKPLGACAWRCDKCQKRQRELARKVVGCKAWVKGKRGRPPKVV